MRNWILALSTAFAIAVLGFTFSGRARADEWNKKTVVTFSAPVEIPGRVLAAGTYVFKLADSQSDRNIVEIYNQDQTKLCATLLAVPDYHLHPSGHTVVRFAERSSTSPEAVAAWFYPGDNYGWEFAYPQPNQEHMVRVPMHHAD